jgi:hypothetical protein
VRKADTSKLAGAAKKISAVYEFPYLAHAPMEPLNCVVDLRKDGCTVWAGSQFQTVDQGAIAATAGLKPEQVVLNTMMAGGGFGRRAVPTRTIWWKRSTSPRSGGGRPQGAGQSDLEPRGRHQGRLLPSVACAPRRYRLDAKGEIVAWTTSSSASPSSPARRSSR